MSSDARPLPSDAPKDPGRILASGAASAGGPAHRNESERRRTLHGLFEECVARTPEATAVSVEGREWTYAQLDARANRLAQFLASRGVGAEVLVGLCVERSFDMIVGLLGILKAGGAYLPLDPSYPAERLRFMLEDSGARLALVNGRTSAEIPKSPAAIVDLDAQRGAIESESEGRLDRESDPGDLAYVIYTSGSTGTPKGVEIEHSSITNHVLCAVRQFRLVAGDRFLQFASLSFDTSAQEIFTTLSSGATLVLRSEEMIATTGAFLAACRDLRLTVVDLPTSYWHELVAEASAGGANLPESIRLVIIGGERALPERFAQWKRLAGDRVHLVNGYGPTEISVAATFWEADPSRSETVSGTVPIGRAIDNVRTYVLDRRQKRVPMGVVGELYIGGAGVGRGYRNRPELTSERFLRDPFLEGGGRMYRTGDRVRLLSSGDLEYLGRVDGQIKLRGYRIEPGEIEAALRGIAGVREAVVQAREEAPGAARLVAWVVLEPSAVLLVRELRDSLARTLPAHMIPSAFVLLDAMPMTASGKIDRASLTSREAFRPELDDPFVAPRNANEETLAGIWREILGIERIGVNDNFFDVGGHSLLALKLLARIERRVGHTLAPAALFRAPTVAQLAKMIEERTQSGRVQCSLVAIQPKGTKPPFFAVHANTGIVYYRGLARQLGADQPVYGLQSQGLDGSRRPHETVEEMAAHYVREIRGLQPEGPYYLGGYSFGGKVAFEMARQLRAQGQRTAFLAFFDTFNLPTTPGLTRLEHARERTRVHIAALKRVGPRARISYLMRRAETLRSLAGGALSRGYEALFRPLRRAQRRVLEANNRAGRRYVPGFYEGRATIFRAMDRTEDWRDRLRPYPHLGWERLCGEGVELIEVPGGHSSLLEEEANVRTLGERLAESLRAAQDTGMAGHITASR